MCGIAGFCDFGGQLKNANETINKMTDSIYNRGKDGSGTYIDTNVALGHRRLSIIDVDKGNQPMISNCKNYVIVYNGELYNTDDLRIELIKKGFEFNTTSDTEVVLNAYICYGVDAFPMFNGIYAFVVYDKRKNMIVAVRDRFGIKPLFYSIVDNTFIFGSEIKAIASHYKVTLEVDSSGLCEVFGMFPSRTEGVGVFKNINEVKYASYGIWSEYGYKEHKYWELESKPHEYSYEDTVQITKELVTDSVKRQMVSDVPISTFLSGGLDSSLITGIISNELKKNGERLSTYSFDYEDNSKYFQSNSFQVDEDKAWVKQIVDIFDTDHKYLECDILNLVDYLETAVDAKDMPGMADIDSSLLYFCKDVAKNHKVVLSGECADEIFGGYPWFHSDDAFNNSTFPWIRNVDVRINMLNESVKSKLQIQEYIQSKYDNTIKAVPTLYGESKEEARRREISYMNIKWFMTTLLDRMDRMSMYAGVEGRVPYADHRIVEFIWNVPWEYKTRTGTKGLLREAFVDLLPYDILYRKKSPYPKTYNPKYEKMLCDKLKCILADSNAPINSIVDRNNMLMLIDEKKDYGKPWFGQLMAGPQLIAYYIQLNYWLEKYNIKVNI